MQGSGPSELLGLVSQIDDQVLALAGSTRSTLGTGGMQSKLAAARRVTQAGGSVIIASGTQREPLTRILAGEPLGTLFLAHGRTASSPQTLDRPDRPAAGLLRRRRRCAARTRVELEEPAGHRHPGSLRRLREGGRDRNSRPCGLRIRSRADELRRSRCAARSAACARTRPERRSALPPTMKSSIATTWRSSSERPIESEPHVGRQGIGMSENSKGISVSVCVTAK